MMTQRSFFRVLPEFIAFRHTHQYYLALTDHDGSPDHPPILSGKICETAQPSFRNWLYRYGLCECGDFLLEWLIAC